MTQEDKAKAYDEAVKAAKSLCEITTSLPMKEYMESLFPELKESEEDRIINNIKKAVEAYWSDEPLQEILAWLEKQSEQKQWDSVKPVSAEDKLYLMQGEQKPAIKLERDDNGEAVLTPFEAELFSMMSEAWQGYSFGEEVNIAKIVKEHSKELLERANEQKPADKVEPKFKVGDWITDGEKVWKIGYIEDDMYIEHRGTISGGGAIKSIDKRYHLWTLQDAKNGDVLQLGEVTAIFESFLGSETCKCYCSVCNGEFEIPSQEADDNLYGCHNAIPATEEQRNLLFQKMKEAGYEWNANKKELKKIEDEPTPQARTGIEWVNTIDDACDKRYSEEYARAFCHELSFKWGFQEGVEWLENQGKKKPTDEEMIEALRTEYEKGKADSIAEMHKLACSEEDGISLNDIKESLLAYKIIVMDNDMELANYIEKEISWLKSIQAKVQPQQKEKWSEDDENMLQSIIATCEFAEQDRDSSPARHLFEMQSNWLKSLKERVQPKPKQEWSEEDENCYNSIVEHLKYSITNGKPETYRRGRLTDWLKSLKERIQPQSTWKPSDEQMQALCSKLPLLTGSGNEVQRVLETLYCDLKKLRNE